METITLNYQPQTIAHHLFRFCQKNKINDLTNKKLNKVLYFVFGTFAANTNNFLFEEEFLAWPHGPVLASIYHEFKENGWQPIQDIKPTNEKLDLKIQSMLEQTYHFYAFSNVANLEETSHIKNGPWESVFSINPYGAAISHQSILTYFKEGL